METVGNKKFVSVKKHAKDKNKTDVLAASHLYQPPAKVET